MRTLIWISFVLLLSGLALAAFVRFHVLPHLDDYRVRLSQELGAVLGRPVAIEALQGQWTGSHLRLQLRNVTVLDRAGRPALVVERAMGELSWWTVVDGRLRFRDLDLDGVLVRLGRDRHGRLWLADSPLPQGRSDDSAADWLLRQGRVELSRGQLFWQDGLLQPGRVLQLRQMKMQLDRGFFLHELQLQAALPAQVKPWQLEASWRGDRAQQWQQWRGRASLRLPPTELASVVPWLGAGLPLQAGQVQGDMQIEFARGNIQQAQLALKAQQIRLQPGQFAPAVAELTAEARLRQDEGGTAYVQFGLLRLRPTFADREQVLDSMLVQWHGSGAAQRGSMRIPGVELEALGTLPAQAQQQWAPFGPALQRLSGRVHDVQLTWQGGLQQPTRWSLQAQLEQAGWAVGPEWPSVRNLSGRLTLSDTAGELTLPSGVTPGVAVVWPVTWTGRREFQQATGRIAWTHAADQPTRLTLDKLRLRSGALSVAVDGVYQPQRDGTARWDIDAAFGALDVTDVHGWLPLQLDAQTRAWLATALPAGRLRNGYVAVHGDPAAIGSASGQPAILRAGADLAGVTLAYAPDWPALEQLDGRLLFENRSMQVIGRRAVIHGTNVQSVRADISDLTSARASVAIKGEVSGATRQFLDFVRRSPLHEEIGAVTDLFDVQGNGNLQLELDIPLLDPAHTRVRGSYTMTGNAIAARDAIPAIEQVRGSIGFSESSVSISQLTGRALGGDVQVQARTRPDTVTEVTVTGMADAAAAGRFYGVPLAERATGLAAYRVLLADANGGLTAHVQSDLVGVGVDLPPPFGKTAATASRLDVDLVMNDKGQETWTVAWQQGLAALLRYDAGPGGKGRVFDRGTLTIGSAQPTVPRRAGLWLTGRLPLVQASDWFGLLSHAGGSTTTDLQGIFLTVDAITLGERVLPAVTLDVALANGQWTGTLQSSLGRGTVDADLRGRGRIALQFDALNWPERGPVSTRPAATGSAASLDPSAWPDVRVAVARLRRGGRDLGRLSLTGSAAVDGYQVQELHLHNDDGDIKARVDWSRGGAGAPWQGRLQFDAATANLGNFAGRFGEARLVQQGRGTLQGQFQWQGAVLPQVTDLAGTVQADAAKGTLLRVNPGIGRLLGLLNIESVLRRVRLDFKDVLSEGLAIDQLQARGRLERGRFVVESMQLIGPAVAMDARGEVQLATGALDMQVRVVPSVSGSVSVAGAIVNPVVGLSLLVLQQLFSNPVGKMLTYTYNIGGTWSQPDIRSRPAMAP